MLGLVKIDPDPAIVAAITTPALQGSSGHESGKLLGRRPALKRNREARLVVVCFPGAEASRRGGGIVAQLGRP